MSPGPENDIPPMPTWSTVKTWLWGAVWTLGGTLWSGLALIAAYQQAGQAVDWPIVKRAIIGGALMALVGYVRKHTALFSAPPSTPAPKPQA